MYSCCGLRKKKPWILVGSQQPLPLYFVAFPSSSKLSLAIYTCIGVYICIHMCVCVSVCSIYTHRVVYIFLHSKLLIPSI